MVFKVLIAGKLESILTAPNGQKQVEPVRISQGKEKRKDLLRVAGPSKARGSRRPLNAGVFKEFRGISLEA